MCGNLLLKYRMLCERTVGKNGQLFVYLKNRNCYTLGWIRCLFLPSNSTKQSYKVIYALFWYNCSPGCGSPARSLYNGANGNLLQEDSCHVLWLPGLLQRVRVPAADHCWSVALQGARKHAKAGLAQSLCCCEQDFFFWALQVSLVGMGFDSKHEFIPPTILLGLLLCSWIWVFSVCLFCFVLVGASILL